MVSSKVTKHFTTYSVYVLPPALWCQNLHCTPNTTMYECDHAGDIRVNRETKLEHLRKYIVKQLGWALLPREFVFCRSVGRSITQIRWSQEQTFRVKIYEPPQAYRSDIFILDATFADKSCMGSGPGLYDISTIRNEDMEEDDYESSTNNSKKKNFNIPKVITSTHVELNTNQRQGDEEDEGEEIDLADLTARREALERKRRFLIRKMIALLAKTKEQRNRHREDWKRRYYSVKKLTPALEEKEKNLRKELDKSQNLILAHIRNRLRDARILEKKEDFQILDELNCLLKAFRLRFDVEAIQRLVDEGKEKLTVEVMLHRQAEEEARMILAEATEKHMRMSMIRLDQLNRLGTSGSPRPDHHHLFDAFN